MRCRATLRSEAPEISAHVPMLLGSNLTERTFFPDTRSIRSTTQRCSAMSSATTGLGDAEARA